MSNSKTSWTVACQTPPVCGILQARTLESVAMPPSRRFPQSREWAPICYISWIGRQVLFFLPLAPPGSPLSIVQCFHCGIVKESESHSVVSNSLQPPGLYSPWTSPGQNIGVGRLSLLQGIFLTQEWNRGLLHCRQILYQLRYQGSPWYCERTNNNNKNLWR